MEVMLEIYRTLKALGMEWKEKRNLGGLGGLRGSGQRNGNGAVIERAREFDGSGNVDLKAASGIYFVETRARVQDVVVRLLHDLTIALSALFTAAYTGADEPATVHGGLDQLPR
jgi:hypothetical protein